MADDQLKFRAEIELLFRAYPWELSAENKALILRQAAKIGMGKLTPESVDWARQHLERMQEGKERLDQIALAETTNHPAPDMKRHREPTPGHVRLKPDDLARELAAWGHVERKEPPPPERTTLLAIVGGIAMATDFDISQPTTAAKKICKVLDDKGMTIGQRTVEEWLKRVNAALDKKSK